MDWGACHAYQRGSQQGRGHTDGRGGRGGRGYRGSNQGRGRGSHSATDTFFSDTPALDDGWTGHDGCKMLQLFAGMTSSYLFGVPMRSEKDVSSSLEDLIRKVGTPIGLFSDNAKSELSRAVKDILRMYCIKDAQSEPGYQNQNYAERRIQDVKRISNSITISTIFHHLHVTSPPCRLPKKPTSKKFLERQVPPENQYVQDDMK